MTIPGVTPFGGTLPVENEPASFPARAEALFTWLTADAAPEINAVATGINSALNDNGTVLDTAGAAIALTTNANTLVDTAGTGNAYTITPTVAVAAYGNGQTFTVRPNRDNTGPVTLQVGGLSPTPVRKISGAGTGFVELLAGDWRTGETHIVTYRNGQFELMTVPLNSFVRVDQDQTVTGTWAGIGQGLTMIAAKTASGSPTLDFTEFDAARYSSYQFVISNLRPVNDGVGLWMRTSSDGGSSYDDAGSDYSHSRVAIAHTVGAALVGGGTDSDGEIVIHPGLLGNAAGEWSNASLMLYSPQTVSHTHATWQISATGNDASGGFVMGSGRRRQTAAVNAVRFAFTAGGIASGTITMYGLRNA